MNDEIKKPGQNGPEPSKPVPDSKSSIPPQASSVTENVAANVNQAPVTRQSAVAPQAIDSTKENGSMERRSFVKWLTIGWVAFAAIVAGYGTLVLRYLFPNVLFEPKQSFLAGFPDEYEIGNVSERFKGKHGVWIVRDTEKLYVLSTTCTHLGCTPNWLENDSKFKCPCHGSGFYKTGINFEGPAPRPLERFRIFLNDDGEIVVDKTKKFQQEKGEWDDPESFLIV